MEQHEAGHKQNFKRRNKPPLVQMCHCSSVCHSHPFLSRGLYFRLNAGAAAHRALLGGPADALIRASRPHHASKETAGPSKAVGIEPEQNPAPVPVPDQLVQPASSAAAAQPGPNEALDKAKNNAPNTAIKPTKPMNKKATRVHRHSTKPRGPKPAAATAASTAAATTAPTQPAAATQQRTLLGGPADVFNRATHARHATKEASGLSKTTSVNNPPEPQQQPSTAAPLAVTEPGSRSLLQFGWSGSSAIASASASAGSGGWGGDSWAGAQGECTEESTDCCRQHALEGETGCLYACASSLLSSPECS